MVFSKAYNLIGDFDARQRDDVRFVSRVRNVTRRDVNFHPFRIFMRRMKDITRNDKKCKIQTSPLRSVLMREDKNFRAGRREFHNRATFDIAHFILMRIKIRYSDN